MEEKTAIIEFIELANAIEALDGHMFKLEQASDEACEKAPLLSEHEERLFYDYYYAVLELLSSYEKISHPYQTDRIRALTMQESNQDD